MYVGRTANVAGEPGHRATATAVHLGLSDCENRPPARAAVPERAYPSRRR